MGSAKPSESPEAPKDSQESRSSSATGKKHRKKTRADSDDDFDSRSAYSNYYTTPYNPEALSPAAYGFPEFVQSPGGQFAPRPYDQHQQLHSMQQMQVQAPNMGAWPHQTYQSVDPNFTWPHNQQSPYELATDFRAMSFQNQVPLQSPPPPPNFNQHYNQQQYYGSQQTWQSSSFQTPSAASQPAQAYPQSFNHASAPIPIGTHDSQPYAFGQLPSQAYPGRTPSKMEHPLPGSYKGKHFNPQSQSFVPGNNSNSNARPFTPQGLPTSNSYFASAFGSAGQLQRQSSASSSPHQPTSPSVQNRVQSQPMTHPLPQPVFPRQPSPNMPLPPKPGQGPPGPNSQQPGSPLPTHTQRPQDQSVIAKWGTPASLPAKPPPSTESFDTSRLSQAPRPPFSAVGTVSRSANGPPSLPPGPLSNGVAIVNGAGQAGKRT